VALRRRRGCGPRVEEGAHNRDLLIRTLRKAIVENGHFFREGTSRWPNAIRAPSTCWQLARSFRLSLPGVLAFDPLPSGHYSLLAPPVSFTPTSTIVPSARLVSAS